MKVTYPGSDIEICVRCDQLIGCTQNHSGEEEDSHKPVEPHDHFLPRLEGMGKR